MKRTFAVLLVVLLLAGTLALAGCGKKPPKTRKPSKDLTIGLHLSAWTLLEYDWSSGGEGSEWKVTVSRNLDWIKNKGYDSLLLDVMEPEGGTYFFKSDVLKENGYNESQDVMGFVVEEAHKRNMTIFADHTVLAWRLSDDLTEVYGIEGNKLSIEQVEEVTETLLDQYDFDGVVEETYPLEYVEAIAKVVKEHPGKLYIHKFDDPWNNADIFMSEDYVGFLSSPEQVEEVTKTGAEGNNLGYFNELFAHAKVVGKPGWVKVTTDIYDLPEGASHNVMLLRAVQFNSDGYFWMPSEENGRELIRNDDPIMNVELLSEYITRFRTPAGKKPVANFVLSLPFSGSEDYRDTSIEFLTHTFGPVSNGLMLSGYDIQATYNRFLPDADAYVVFTAGNVEDMVLGLAPEILDLLEQDKPVIFVVWGFTNRGNWEKALPKLGISADWVGSNTTGEVEDVMYGGREIQWSSPTIWEYPIDTSVLEPQDVTTGEVVVSGKKDGDDIVLISRKGNKYLVNANVLDLQTTYIFNKLLDGNLEEPFYGYGVVGQRSAFLALKDTPVVVNLPFEYGEDIRLTKFSSDGRLVSEEKITYTEPLRTELDMYELLIVD